MIYADSHIEFIHHPEDLKSLPNPEFLESQISPSLINIAKPELLFAAAYVDPTPEAWERLLWILSEYKKQAKANNWIIVSTKKDLSKKGVKIILHVEALHAIGSDMNKIETLYKEGVRSIGLTHNPSNQFGGGSLTPEIGLTELGKQAARKLVGIGMILDFAHLSTASFQDACDLNLQKPLISHAGIQAVFANPRNLADSVISRLAKENGHLGIGLAASFLCREKANLNHVMAQIHYAVNKLGSNRVGIGSDLGGITSGVPEGLENIAKIRTLLPDLPNQKILGANLIDFLQSGSNLSE